MLESWILVLIISGSYGHNVGPFSTEAQCISAGEKVKQSVSRKGSLVDPKYIEFSCVESTK